MEDLEADMKSIMDQIYQQAKEEMGGEFTWARLKNKLGEIEESREEDEEQYMALWFESQILFFGWLESAKAEEHEKMWEQAECWGFVLIG